MGVSKQAKKSGKPKAKVTKPAKKPVVKKKPAVARKKSSVPAAKKTVEKKKPTPAKKLVPAKKLPAPVKVQNKKPVAVSKPAIKVSAATGKTKPVPPVSAKTKSLAAGNPAAAPKAASLKKGAIPALVSDPSIKRPSRPIFVEVKPGSERVIKRGDKTLAAAVSLDIQSRRKGVSSEETPEELVIRIERELEHQFFFKRNAVKPQMCTKCGINSVAVRFTLDKELGYCDDCAKILRLGESKESRRMEINPLAKKEGEPGAPPKPPDDADDDESNIKLESVPDVD